MAGRFFEEWAVGDRIAHDIRRTVTETDNLLFTTMTHNPQPLHLDAEAAKASEFGKILVNGTFTFALMVGLSVGDTTLGTLVANLGYDKVRHAEAGVHRRYAEGRDRGGRDPREPLTAGGGDRHLLAQAAQSEGRGRLPVPALGTDPAERTMRLRSLLFVPGDRPDRFDKAMASGADAVILDLEDAVAPGRKDAARQAVADFLAERGRAVGKDGVSEGPGVFVRINPLDLGMADADLAAAKGADGIVLPKAEGAASLAALDRLLGDEPAAILPIATETPTAVFQLGSYGGVTSRLCGLTWGAEDLPAAIGAATSREPDGSLTDPYRMVRALALFAAHAAGVPPIETVHPDIRDMAGLERIARQAARDGFSGMLAIHPAQVSVINAAFTPTAEAIAAARAIVDAFAAHPEAGALQVNGRMVDAPHLKQAKRVLAQAGEGGAP